MIKDVQISDDGQRVIFSKLLWHDSEIMLAKCFSFEIDLENKMIISVIAHTHKKALFEFIRIAFKNFNEAPGEKDRRDKFFSTIEDIYAHQQEYALSKIKEALPYFDNLYAHQKEVLALTFWKQKQFLALDMGLGKAQPLNSKVLTPSGFINMGDVKPGMEVISSNGKPCNVLSIHPQGKIPYYRVYFSDGFFTECCDDHLWICRQRNLIKKYSWRVRSLKSLRNDLIISHRSGNGLKWVIPKVKPVEFNRNDEKPISPYLLGVLLGDGCMVNTASLSTNDHDELIPIVSKLLPAGMTIKKQKGDNYSWNIVPEKVKMGARNPLLEIVKDLGLFNKRSHEKFIPENYFYGTVNERIELLQGLLDTDGHISEKNSRISITTVSTKMKDGIIFLVQSLGGIATFGEDKRDGKRLCYFINLNLPDEIIPFKLSRRLKRWRPKKRFLSRKIEKVEYIGETECQCITVNSEDNSYITDNFIVTHNSLISASASRVHNVRRTLILAPAAVKWNWMNDLIKFGFSQVYFSMLDAKKSRSFRSFDERFVICNYDILDKFMDVILSDDIGHIILDESHLLKGHLARRTKLVKHIVEHFPNARISFLSGTPIANRVNDLFSYMQISGNEMGKNHKKFLEEFTLRASGRGGERVTGGKNLQELNLRISNFMIRRTKQDCLDLPGKVFRSYKFELDDYREEYNKIIEEMSNERSLSSLTGNIHSLNIITAKAKKKGIIDLAETLIEGDEKVIIFGGYKEPLQELADYFGRRAVKVTGEVDSFTRSEYVKRFIEDPECVVFLGNWVAAGVGINLVNSSNIIVQSFPLTPAHLHQGLDRSDRIGQTKIVNVHYTFCEDSVDEHIHDLIVDKESDINAVIDNGKETILREDMIEILIKRILKKDDIEFQRFAKSSINIEKNKDEEEVSGGLSEVENNETNTPVVKVSDSWAPAAHDSTSGKPANDKPKYYLMFHDGSDCLFIMNEDERNMDVRVELDQLFCHEDINMVIMEGQHRQMKLTASFDSNYTPNPSPSASKLLPVPDFMK